MSDNVSASPKARRRKPRIGKLHNKGTLFFRMDCGEAEENGKPVFALATNLGDGSPIVRSEKSGRWFTLSWRDIVNLAIEAGVERRG